MCLIFSSTFRPSPRHLVCALKKCNICHFSKFPQILPTAQVPAINRRCSTTARTRAAEHRASLAAARCQRRIPGLPSAGGATARSSRRAFGFFQLLEVAGDSASLEMFPEKYAIAISGIYKYLIAV